LKIGDSLFQIGEVNIDIVFKQNIISLLLLGNKFIPNYFYSSHDYINYILKEIDINLSNFNKNLFFQNNKSIRSLESNKENVKPDSNFIDNNYMNIILKKIKSNKTKKIDENKLFISNETSSLRFNIHSKLFKEYKNIEIKPNIDVTQLNYLLKFQKEKPFKIINCDKNVGNALISNDLYDLEVHKYLSISDTFIKIHYDPLEETVNTINYEINGLYDQNHISDILRKKLLINLNECKLGSFRLLAKLHKENFSWRPIINCKNHPNTKIARLLDSLFKPIIAETESYIKDSQNLIQLTQNITFKKEPIIISLDFTNLYLNINPIHATKSITDLMHKKLNNKHLNIIALYNILLLMHCKFI
jgi:hypothetical protein